MFPLPMALVAGASPLSFTLDGTAQDDAAAATQVYTMVGAIPIGALISVVGGNSSTLIDGLASVADSRGNVYAVNKTNNTPATRLAAVGVAMAPCTVALQAGDTVTLTWDSSNTGHACAVGSISNPLTNTAAAFDVGDIASGTSSTPTQSTGTLATTNEIVIGAVASGNNATGTQDGAFTTIANLTYKSATRLLIAGYKIVSATTSVAYAPTLPASVVWAEAVAAYKGK